MTVAVMIGLLYEILPLSHFFCVHIWMVKGGRVGRFATRFYFVLSDCCSCPYKCALRMQTTHRIYLFRS